MNINAESLSRGGVPSGFAFNYNDQTDTLSSVKRVLPNTDNDVDLGSVSKRFKNIECVTLNGETPVIGSDYLPLSGGIMSGEIDMAGYSLTNVSSVQPSSVYGNCLFGYGASNSGNSAVNIGFQSTGVNDSVSVGRDTNCQSGESVCVGSAASSTSYHGIALGFLATVGNSFNNTGIGCFTVAGDIDNSSCIAIGNFVENKQEHSTCIGDVDTRNIRSMAVCDLGTVANPFNALRLKYSQVASGSMYSMHESVSLSNSNVETNMLTGNSVGSLIFNSTQSLGMVFRMRASWRVDCLISAVLTLRFKINGATYQTHVVSTTSALSGVSCQSNIEGLISSDGSVIQISSTFIQNGKLPFTDSQGLGFDRTATNTISFTAQYGTASGSNSISLNSCHMETIYCQ